jgi:hypothetical protein
MNFLTRLRGLQAPVALDEPLRLADAGGVTPGTGGGGSTVIISRGRTVRGPRGHAGRDALISPVSQPTTILIARNMRDVRRQTNRAGGALNPTGVTPGTYPLATVAIGADGRITGAASGSGGYGGAINITADVHPAIPTIYDDEFEFGSAIDTSGSRFTGANSWTAFNATGYSTVVAQGSLVLTSPTSGSSLVGGYSQPISGSTWSYTAKVSMRSLATGTTVSGGLFIATASGTSGKIINFFMTSAAADGIAVQHLTNATTLSTNALLTGTLPVMGGAWIPFYMQISYDGTNLHYGFSSTGIAGSFVPVFSELPATFMGGVPTVVGVAQGSQTGSCVILDWFRKTL